MCGIAGLILRDGHPDPAILARAAGWLGHRGPDESGVEIMGAVGLAHTRLSIIDLAGGHQPIRDPRGDYVLVANGEIYNFVELMAQARDHDWHFSSRSDSETIVYAYARHGVEGLARLNGMFAFALYDVRRRSLVLGRDRLGIKPLYFATLPDRLVFASEIKALLPLLPRTPGLSAAALARTLEVGFNSGRDTLFDGVRRLDPGTVLIVGPDLSLKLVPYWSPLAVVPRESLSLTDAQDAFAELFDQVLGEHMRADVPYGLFLSGGLDSASLLWRLSERSSGPLHTFSVGYGQGGGKDELADAARVARHFGSVHTQLRLDLRDALNALPFSVWAADDLVYDPACLPTALLARRAARHLKIVFTGEGGDEVFAGYGRYRNTGIQRLAAWLRAPHRASYRWRSRWPETMRRACFGPELELARASRHEPMAFAWCRAPREWGYVRRAQLADMQTELRDDLLVKLDRMLMGFGLEGRVPFLDHRLVELGLSLPDRVKIRRGVGKVLIREWARAALPPEHTRVKKRGFGVPFEALLRGELLTRIEQRLEANPMLRAWLRPGGVAAVARLQREAGRGTGLLMQLMQLAAWYRIFLDGPRRRPGIDDDLLDWL